ncbi:MAG: energy transducer TonB, partial [Alphaproteobacteria bacterium]|nr:energy transducer TonB [Alphaproteobacteria bacterium]
PSPAQVPPQVAPQQQPTKPAPIRKPTAAPSQPRQAAISDTRLADFRANLSRKLASAFRYPTLARERNKTGTVSVSFELDANGNVTKASVVQSSGHDELDADALATIRRAAPFEPPPAGAPRSYTFPIAYRLR